MTDTAKTPSIRNPLLNYADKQLEAGGYCEVTEFIDGAWQVEIEINDDGEAWFVMTDEANPHEERLGREITREDLDRARDILYSQLNGETKRRHPVSVDFACNSMEYGDGDRFLEWTFPAGHADELDTAEDAIEKCQRVLANVLYVSDPDFPGSPYAFASDD